LNNDYNEEPCHIFIFRVLQLFGVVLD
jgi:hypothetical protein